MTVAELIALLRHADPYKPVRLHDGLGHEARITMVRMDPEEAEVILELTEVTA